MFVTVRHIESIVVELALQLVPPAVALGKFHNMAKSFLKTPFIQKRILILMLLGFTRYYFNFDAKYCYVSWKSKGNENLKCSCRENFNPF